MSVSDVTTSGVAWNRSYF